MPLGSRWDIPFCLGVWFRISQRHDDPTTEFTLSSGIHSPSENLRIEDLEIEGVI
jgi:hypothetical protein